ncbi:MAG TPA: sulfite exporter TauE/SafE family protein [Xanthobacteraceae bacterium]|nr:sulfite exporter TauE/SafE family protein [Xanthobacteraceae bacterium]
MLAPIITAPLFYLIAIPAVIFLGLAKGGFSGVATGATPLLALYLPPLEAAALLLPIVICQDAISIHVYRREWSGSNLKVLLPGAGLGLGLGWLFASYVSDDAIRLLIGVTALAFVGSSWLRAASVRPTQGTLLRGLFWGTISGFMSFATQGGGPPFQVYTLPQQLPKMTFVGTTTIFFATINVMKIVPYFMLGQFSAKNLSTSLVLLPIAVIANFAGIWIVKTTPTALFYRISYILLFILGSALFFQGSIHLMHGVR